MLSSFVSPLPFCPASYVPRSTSFPSLTLTARLPSSVATIHHRPSRATIHIVGCVHGSQVSAGTSIQQKRPDIPLTNLILTTHSIPSISPDDVRTLLDDTSPDAVVLELCESRLISLKTILLRPPTAPSLKTPLSFSEISRIFGGPGPALVAFLFESMYKLQVLSGVTPGIEFSYPIFQSFRWTLICGDAPAKTTVTRLYSVFTKPWESVRDSVSSIRDLLRSIFFPVEGGINIVRLFLGNRERLWELVKLVLPAAGITGAVGAMGNAAALAFEGGGGVVSGGGWEKVFSVGEVGFVGYIVFSTLQFMKVLIADRDRVLADSILKTVGNGGVDGMVVCAVVGLLHVNGIVRLIGETVGET